MDGQALRALRKSRNETQSQFAKHFGVSRTNISNWEAHGTPKLGAGAAHVEHVLLIKLGIRPKVNSGG